MSPTNVDVDLLGSCHTLVYLSSFSTHSCSSVTLSFPEESPINPHVSTATIQTCGFVVIVIPGVKGDGVAADVPCRRCRLAPEDGDVLRLFFLYNNIRRMLLDDTTIYNNASHTTQQQAQQEY